MRTDHVCPCTCFSRTNIEMICYIDYDIRGVHERESLIDSVLNKCFPYCGHKLPLAVEHMGKI